MAGKITIKYEKETHASDFLTMKTTVQTTGTSPSDLYDCLLISKGSASIEERIYDIATFDDIFAPTPTDLLPTEIRQFSAPSLDEIDPMYSEIQVDDVIVVTNPDFWKLVFGVPATTEYTVVTKVDSTHVVVDQDFPAFGRSLTFTVKRGVTTILTTRTDGLANRDYSGVVGIYFRARSHSDWWDNVEVADNKYEALRASAQSLVNAYNEDKYTETVEELYE